LRCHSIGPLDSERAHPAHKLAKLDPDRVRDAGKGARARSLAMTPASLSRIFVSAPSSAGVNVVGGCVRSSPKWVEFEDGSASGRSDRIVQIDPVDNADECEAAWYGSRESAQAVSEELDFLPHVQLGRGDLFLPAVLGDRRATGSAQIADPVDITPRAPDPPPA
jgi:hypothetical protein